MGGKIVLPEPDANITKVIKNFKFTPKDISDFWKIFQKLDKKKTGLVTLDSVFKRAHLHRSIFTDCLVDLFEIEHDGELNFSDFLLLISSFCFFELNEILKFCFFVFDQDRTGFFSIEDLNDLMNMVHNIKTPNTVLGNVKGSWQKLTISSDRLSFDEFKQIHNAFPKLFEPAFRMQIAIIEAYMGERWWNAKKNAMLLKKELEDEVIEAEKKRKEKRKANKKARKIQRNMGIIKYYFCPCWRSLYDPTISEYDKLTIEERAKVDAELALKRRQLVLKIKNPETAPWEKFKKKAKDKHNKSDELVKIDEEVKFDPIEVYMKEKLVTTEKPRQERALSRAERKQQRQNDNDLKLRQRQTVSGVDV
eukprot:gene10336-13887_t